MVGVTGFEPAAPCSQSTCATKLRHTPAMEAVPHKQQSNYIMSIGSVSSPCGRLTEISEFRGQSVLLKCLKDILETHSDATLTLP